MNRVASTIVGSCEGYSVGNTGGNLIFLSGGLGGGASCFVIAASDIGRPRSSTPLARSLYIFPITAFLVITSCYQISEAVTSSFHSRTINSVLASNIVLLNQFYARFDHHSASNLKLLWWH